MAAGSIKTIVIGYDGSEHGDAALELAASLATKYDASVIVVTVFAHLPRIAEPDQSDVDHIFESRELADKAVKKLQAGGVRAEPDVLEGPAAEAILNAAECHEADLIIVGSRGLGQFKGLLLGSTSDRVVQHATMPVLVVR